MPSRAETGMSGGLTPGHVLTRVWGLTPGHVRSVALLDELAAEAWPAPIVSELDGWTFRWGNGFTGRANSVWPRHEIGDLTLDQRIAAAEAFYLGHGGRPKFQLSPASKPESLDADLAARGYERSTGTYVQVAATEEVVARTGGGGRAARIDDRPDDGWLELCESRRRGAGRTILHALARWALERGAGSMYLQVEESNSPALGLYAGAGLATLYAYHYRTLAA